MAVDSIVVTDAAGAVLVDDAHRSVVIDDVDHAITGQPAALAGAGGAPSGEVGPAGEPLGVDVPDLTGDGVTDDADVSEVLLGWTEVRSRDARCDLGEDRVARLDVDGDGCLAVGDLQAVARAAADRSASIADAPATVAEIVTSIGTPTVAEGGAEIWIPDEAAGTPTPVVTSVASTTRRPTRTPKTSTAALVRPSALVRGSPAVFVIACPSRSFVS
jgi:hypothetical protein